MLIQGSPKAVVLLMVMVLAGYQQDSITAGEGFVLHNPEVLATN